MTDNIRLRKGKGLTQEENRHIVTYTEATAKASDDGIRESYWFNRGLVRRKGNTNAHLAEIRLSILRAEFKKRGLSIHEK